MDVLAEDGAGAVAPVAALDWVTKDVLVEVEREDELLVDLVAAQLASGVGVGPEDLTLHVAAHLRDHRVHVPVEQKLDGAKGFDGRLHDELVRLEELPLAEAAIQ